MKPKAEITISRSMVQALMREPHDDLSHLPLVEANAHDDPVLAALGSRTLTALLAENGAADQ